VPEENRKGTSVLTDERNPERPKIQLIDIIQLNDTYQSQPRDNNGVYIHAAPDERVHADVYLGPKDRVKVEVAYSASRRRKPKAAFYCVA